MNLNRREFVLASAAAASVSAAEYKPRLAAQTFIWMQQLRQQKRTPAEGVADVIGGTLAAGFENAELMSAFLTPELRPRTLELLRSRGLAIPIVYHGGPMHTAEGAEKTIAEAVELVDALRGAGVELLNFNPSPKPGKALKSDAELATQAQAINRLAAEVEKRGIPLVLHHHDAEMLENAREWRHLLENTAVPLCIDTMWAARGGQDPMAILRQTGRRLGSLHVRNTKNGVCTEAFGDGDIDHRKVAAHLREISYRGWIVVELFHEPQTQATRPLEANLRLSREYAEKVFGL